MADIKLPDLGENVEEGEVITIMVAVGDSVAVDQPLLELETGKATVEIPSPVAGTVEKILVSEGDRAGVGTLVMRISGEGAAPAEFAAEPPAEESGPTPEPEKSDPTVDLPTVEEAGPIEDHEFIVHDLGEGVEEGDIIHVLVAEGDHVEVDQALIEVETGKATVEIPSTLAGTISKVLVEEGGKLKPGQTVCLITGVLPGKTDSASPSPEAKPEPDAPRRLGAPAPDKPYHVFSKEDPQPAPAPVLIPDSGTPVRAAPSVRKFAREIGLQIHIVPPNTPGGRITIDNVKAYAKTLLSGAGSTGAGVAVPPLPDVSKYGPVREESMSTIRKLTAEHMAMCWSTIPHVTQNNKVDITDLEAWRKANGKEAEEAGGKLTLTAILVRQVANVLKQFPNFNASIDMAGRKIIYKDYIHIGIAVDTPKGLMVPVIRDADQKNILELSMALTDIAVRARDGKIKPSELQGGTFTITNLGGIGGGYFTPIVNHPEVAILGIGRASLEGVYKDGEFAPHLMMPMSLSYDHRVIDGADGARFTVALKSTLESPLSLTELSESS
jgi:pyruvate dehydrogenase E2 component (dihydrolipoamide acetyltransferase)